MGWSFCSTDAIVLGSALVPFGLIFPYLSCPVGFVSTSCLNKGRAELVLEINDVHGKPMECKSCELQVLEAMPLRDVSASRRLYGRGITEIRVREVVRRSEVVGTLRGLVLLRGISGECRNQPAGFFADRVLELLCVDKCEFLEGKPEWQLLLAFLYKSGYWALVSISDNAGNILEAILKPFTIHYAMLSVLDMKSLESCRLVTGASDGLPDIVGSAVSTTVTNKDGRSKRNKIKVVTLNSFRETVFTQPNDVDAKLDLEDIYFTGDCNKSKKLRFLKCWMKQIKKSSSHCQIKPQDLNKPPIVKCEDSERVLDSQQELEEHISSSSSAGTHLSLSISEEALPLGCLDDPEAFFGSITQKVEHGLCSEDADLGNLAERLVALSIHAMHAKFSSKEGVGNSDVKIAAEVSQLLLKNSKDLILKYKGSNSSSLASKQGPGILNNKNKIRDHELQIFFRMELLKSKIGASIEEKGKQKMVKDICSLLQNIEFDLEGDSFCGESLLEFAGRTIKSRYAHSLGNIIHRVYNQMEFYSFDKDEEEASDSLPNSNNDDLKKYEETYGTTPGDAIGRTGGSSSQNTIHQQEIDAKTHQKKMDTEHEQQLKKAQERRHKARRFSSFTSWMPDLQRVWAIKTSKAERPIHEPLPKVSKRRKQRETPNDMVCETPMSGNKLHHVQGGDGRVGKSDCCDNSSYRSLSKALFPDKRDFSDKQD